MIGTYKGKIFEAHRDLTFTLGEGGDLGIPRGVEIALEKMKKKERAEIKVRKKQNKRFLKILFALNWA